MTHRHSGGNQARTIIRVAGGALRRLVDVAQRLVAAGRVGVVVAVALQVVEEDVGGDVVAVAAVLGETTLVAPVLALLAQQAVVLEVVDDLEQDEAQGLEQQVGQNGQAEAAVGRRTARS